MNIGNASTPVGGVGNEPGGSWKVEGHLAGHTAENNTRLSQTSNICPLTTTSVAHRYFHSHTWLHTCVHTYTYTQTSVMINKKERKIRHLTILKCQCSDLSATLCSHCYNTMVEQVHHSNPISIKQSPIFPPSNLDPSNYDHACCIHRFAYSGDFMVISSMCSFLLGFSLLAQCFQSSSILEHVSGLHCISIHPASMYVYATLSLLTHLLMASLWTTMNDAIMDIQMPVWTLDLILLSLC